MCWRRIGRCCDDMQRQMVYYDEDMQRNFKARLGEIDSLLYEMEKRGNAFFDDRLRLARVPDLLRSKQLEADFEKVVVARHTAADRAAASASWSIGWSNRICGSGRPFLIISPQRSAEHQGRIVGDSGPREGHTRL